MNGRAYRNGDDEPDNGDPACPTCQRISTVSKVGDLFFCGDCDLGFVAGDAERVDPKWAAKYRERREQGHPPPIPVQRYEKPTRVVPLTERVEKEGA